MIRLCALPPMRALSCLGASRSCAAKRFCTAQAARAQMRWACSQSPRGNNTGKCVPKPFKDSSPMSLRFWSSISTWRRAALNTARCLVGCTLGDFSTMWILQACYPGLGMGLVMGISMASGLSTSMMLETVLLRVGRDQLPWPAAARTAAGMSMISMVTMEIVENAVDYGLTGGQVQLDSLTFWAAGAVAMFAGFLAPLPYNYGRLRKFGKACH